MSKYPRFDHYLHCHCWCYLHHHCPCHPYYRNHHFHPHLPLQHHLDHLDDHMINPQKVRTETLQNLLFWSSVLVQQCFLDTSVCILAMVLHSKCQCHMLHLQNSSICASRIPNKCCKTSTTKKRDALYFVDARYCLHADDQNTFHLIRLSLTICDPHGPKQNGRYCWLCRIWTGNDCNFSHYKIRLAFLHITKWRDHVYKKEIEILTTQLAFSAKILCFSKFRHSIEASGYEPSQFPPFTCLACSFQL